MAGTTPTDAGGTTSPTVAVGGAETTSQGLPLYVWLAVAAGIALWVVFRSVILESAKGIRPDGVLAQIHQINAQRAGVETAETSGGPSAISSFFGGIKSGTASLFEKLKLTRKG